MLNKNSIGIDIGPDNISIVWLQSRLKGYTLVEHRHYSLPESTKKTERDKYTHIASRLNTFIAECNIASPEIYLSIPGERAIIKDLRFPLTVKENFRDTIRFEMEKYVPFSSELIYHDCQVIDEDKKNKQITILLVVVKKEELDPYLQMCNQIDNGVCSLEITPTATANALSTLADLRSLDTFAYIGHAKKNTSIELVTKQKLFSSRTIRDFDPSSPAEYLAHEVKICQKNTLLPGSALPVFVAAETSIAHKKEEEKSFDIIPLDITETVPSPQLLSAFGLALKGMQKVPGQINLMPVSMRKKPNRKAITLIYSLIALNIILLMTWSGSMLMHHRITLNDLHRQTAELTKRVHDVPVLEKNALQAQNKLAFIQQFQHGRPYTLDVIMELTSIIPQSVWIQHFKQTERTVELDGFAESASDLITILESSNLFHEVAFLSTISKTKDNRERFKLRLKLK